ncbi:MAG: hypothetical protein LBU84_08980, partial [Prevotella sp.]|nr:hypothetical protein [Prevotella sp.]
MGKKLFLLFVFYLFIHINSSAIDISKYRFHSMPETSYYGGIQSIVKDSVGRIWYSGTDAFFMYNGSSFYQLNDLLSTKYPKSHWAYGEFITDKEKRLYFSTNQGLLRFNYEKFDFDFILKGK